MATKKLNASEHLGRPTLYRPEYCNRLIDHMSQGLSFITFAATIDVNTDTLYEWERNFHAFSEAKKAAFNKCQLFWENIGIEGIWNEPNGKTLNTGNYVFQMKNRFKWNDRVEVNAVIAPKRELAEVSDDELDKLLG
jgi:transposase